MSKKSLLEKQQNVTKFSIEQTAKAIACLTATSPEQEKSIYDSLHASIFCYNPQTVEEMKAFMVMGCQRFIDYLRSLNQVPEPLKDK